MVSDIIRHAGPTSIMKLFAGTDVRLLESHMCVVWLWDFVFVMAGLWHGSVAIPASVAAVDGAMCLSPGVQCSLPVYTCLVGWAEL